MQFSSEFWVAIVLSLLIGLVPALVLYWKTRQLPSRIKGISFVLRWLGASLIALVILLPREPGWREETVPGQVNVFVDNSYSMHVLGASSSMIDSFINNVSNKLRVRTWLFGSRLREGSKVTFSDSFTDLGSPLRLASLLKGIDSSEIVLITDGNHNYGILDYSALSGGLLLSVGDSVLPCAISISEVIVPTPAAMQPFVIKAIIESQNCPIKQFKLIAEGDVSHQQELETSAQRVLEVQIPVGGLPAGTYSTMLKIVLDDSVIYRRPVSFTVIDKKQKIAVVSDITHPDIGAFRRSLESFKTMETELYRSDEAVPQPLPDAIIIIGFPEQVDKWLNTKLPYLWVLDGLALSQIKKFDNKIKVQRAHGVREVQGSPATDFLSLPGDIALLRQFAELLPSLPPLTTTGVISAEYEKIFMWQSIEDYVLNQPLVFCTENTKCYALGTGFWLWRLHTYRFLNSHKPFDEFVYSIMQFLINKGKVKLITSMPSHLLYKFQPVIINAAIVIPGKGYSTEYPVEYKILDSTRQVVKEGFMTPSQWNYQVRIDRLQPGKYFYEVRTVVGGKTYTTFGSFTILDIIPEQMVAGRNNQFVEKWRSAGGKTFPLDNWKHAIEYLLENAKEITIIKPVGIDWLTLAIIATLGVFFLVAEWFLRRYYGII
ncbi:MAG: hypothetical protein GXO48_04195 [Chlorobi bacterium]|nr:hypothetical protein [Chlorobiota bacterium]